MKNIIKKINIFVFVVVLSFAGTFTQSAFAVVTPNNTYWNGEELVPIDWGSGVYIDENNDDDDDNNGNNDGEVVTLSATDIDENSAELRGEVTEGNNVDVWFVIDNDDSTPACSDDDLEVSVSGDVDEGDEFSRTVSGLQDDETYYFRACSDDDSGSVHSFTTDEEDNDDDDNNNGGNTADLVAITSPASTVTSSSATLNGFAIINDGGDAVGWFEYGRTTALGSATPSQALGDEGSKTVAQPLYGLASGTAYYFRFVNENDSGREYGDIRSFVTGTVSSTPIQTGNTGTVAGASTTNTVVTTNTSFLNLTIESNLDTVMVNDVVTLTVAFKNVSGKELKNVIMNVELPAAMSLRRSTLGDYVQANHSILVSVLSLPKDAKGEFVIMADVTKAARGQSVLVASVEGVYDHPSIEGAQVSSVDYAIMKVEGGSKDQSANALFAGFFPTSLVGWLLIVGIILVIILIARKISKDKEARAHEQDTIKIAK